MSATEKSKAAVSDYRIKAGSSWAGAWKKAAAVGVIGLAGAGFAFTQDPKRAAFSYLFAFFFFLAIALGALFFVVVQHLTKSGWSVTVRRTAEFFMSGLAVFLVLVIPVLFNMGKLFPWVEHGESHAPTAEHAPEKKVSPALTAPAARGNPHATGDAVEEGLRARLEHKVHQAHEEEEARILAGKAPYLNKSFFLVRAVFYVGVWALLSFLYFRWSTDQDKSKKVALTASAQKLAPVAMMLFAITITFAGFDWLMSLDPMWYSTIFGVYIFAGSVIAGLTTIILVTLGLRRSGLLGDSVTTEHYHDLGKLLFGWLVFWAYISFSQFFLIWYANIPEELAFYHRRWAENAGTWKTLSASLLFVHFAIPFWLIMSRNVKRRPEILGFAAALLWVTQVIESYWIVMPNLGPFAPSWVDLACFIGVGGVYFAYVFRQMETYALIPVGDPRLVRALKFENA